MSYLRDRYGGRRLALGGLAETITSAAGTAIDVGTDPYLAEVLCRVKQLKAIKDQAVEIPVCAKTPGGLAGGVGLGKAIVPLRAYVYAQQHTWVYPVALLAIFGLPMFIGYELGKG